MATISAHVSFIRFALLSPNKFCLITNATISLYITEPVTAEITPMAAPLFPNIASPIITAANP